MHSVCVRLFRLLDCFATVAVAIVIFAQGIWILRNWDSPPPRDRDSWKQVGHGMTKDAVLEIMGKPDRSYVTNGRLNWLYDIGGFDYFCVEFDPEDEVVGTSF